MKAQPATSEAAGVGEHVQPRLAPILRKPCARVAAHPVLLPRDVISPVRAGGRRRVWPWVWPLLAWLFGWAPPLAVASSVSNEVGVQTTQTTASNPRSGSVADLLKANIDVTDDLVFRGALGFTYEFATPVPTGGAFAGTDASIFAVSAGLDYDVTEALTLSIDGVYSPPSSQSVNSEITLSAPDGGTVNRNGLLTTVASSYGLDVSADYTIGDPFTDKVAWTLDADVGWLALSVDQTLEKLENTQGTASENIARIQEVCETTKVPAQVRQCRALKPLLSNGTDTLDEFRLAAGGTLSLHADTDFGLQAAYYLYSKDPTEFGYYSALTSGRTALHNFSLGSSVPLAPYLFTARGDAHQRVGPFTFGLWYQFGIYASDLGTSQTVGGRVEWRIDTQWKVWLTGSVQVDLQPPDALGLPLASGTQSILSGAFAAGVRARF